MVIAVLDDEFGCGAKLSKSLGLPLVKATPDSYYLALEKGQWIVRDGRQGRNFFIRIDLDTDLGVLKKQKLNPKKDLLSRALGVPRQNNYLVLDGTLGFARDAVHMIACGAQVVGYEKHPITFLLLESALHQAAEVQKHLSIFQGDCLLGVKAQLDTVDCVYLDPMFENVKKKSAPKKSLAFLREISPVDVDVQRVIEGAIGLGIKRLVVKRPINSDHLYGKPNIVYEGKLIRYDVYTR